MLNRLLLQPVSKQGLSLLENWRTVTSCNPTDGAINSFSSHLSIKCVCVCVEVAKGHPVEVYENVPTGRQKGLYVLWKDMEGEQRLGGEVVSL